MINDFNADQARANSNQVEQLSRDFILDELLQSAKNMSLAKNNFASQEYHTAQLYPRLIEEVVAELENRKFTVETIPNQDGRKITFRLSW